MRNTLAIVVLSTGLPVLAPVARLSVPKSVIGISSWSVTVSFSCAPWRCAFSVEYDGRVVVSVIESF